MRWRRRRQRLHSTRKVRVGEHLDCDEGVVSPAREAHIATLPSPKHRIGRLNEGQVPRHGHIACGARNGRRSKSPRILGLETYELKRIMNSFRNLDKTQTLRCLLATGR